MHVWVGVAEAAIHEGLEPVVVVASTKKLAEERLDLAMRREGDLWEAHSVVRRRLTLPVKP